MAKTKYDAAETYEGCQQDIASLIAAIQMELEAHAEMARDEGINYAHAGDLHYIGDSLAKVLGFLIGIDEEDEEETNRLIADYLEDLKA
ncbi:MAG: hypothetical protein QGG53_43470 [Planctomycetota bacterium]|nr:hypothetical protein [Planctomycetota bacterium]